MVRIFFFLFFLLWAVAGNCQVFPPPYAVLNYRIIGFSVPSAKLPTHYTVQIAPGNLTDENVFDQKIIISKETAGNRVLAEVPEFGMAYTWRYITANGATRSKSPLMHFSTRMFRSVDSNKARLRITKFAETNKDSYVFVDGLGALYDMQGKPVWFLPRADSDLVSNPTDIKVSPQNTITFLMNGAKEMKYGDTAFFSGFSPFAKGEPQIFHHEFTRLENGNYLVLIGRLKKVRNDRFADSVARDHEDSSRFYRDFRYSMIVEYDSTGQKILWSWSGLDYALHSDLSDIAYSFDIHENSFYFDARRKVIYVGFKNINRIIAIKYPEGTILHTYGAVHKKGSLNFFNSFFCSQHSVGVTSENQVLLYNNNVCDTPFYPGIMMVDTDDRSRLRMRKVWEYICPIDTVAECDKGTLTSKFKTGGSVKELPDRSFLVYMGLPASRMFIVDRNKHTSWSAVAEQYNEIDKHWERSAVGYRVSLISRKTLEKMVWNR